MERIIILICILLAFLLVVSTLVQTSKSTLNENSKQLNNINDLEYRYIASRHSEVYHSADCFYVDRIKPQNKVYFETAFEAELAGFRKSERC